MFERTSTIIGTATFWLLWLGMVGGLLLGCLDQVAGWGGVLAFLVALPFVALVGGTVIAPLSFAVGALGGLLISLSARFTHAARS
ncbi:MAG: hypothetical protein JNM11_14185 [Chitinimonas sp.]|nr:hypothetical protein [Chitinimonas sp.]